VNATDSAEGEMLLYDARAVTGRHVCGAVMASHTAQCAVIAVLVPFVNSCQC
jgi:hypothetical protein